MSRSPDRHSDPMILSSGCLGAEDAHIHGRQVGPLQSNALGVQPVTA